MLSHGLRRIDEGLSGRLSDEEVRAYLAFEPDASETEGHEAWCRTLEDLRSLCNEVLVWRNGVDLERFRESVEEGADGKQETK